MTVVDERILTRAECMDITTRAAGFARDGGPTDLVINSSWNGELRWARNRVSLTSDRRNIQIWIRRTIDGSTGQSWTNQIDSTSLEAAVRAAERMCRIKPGVKVIDFQPPSPTLPLPTPTIWSDATYNATTQMRGDLARVLSEEAEARGMLSAGFMKMAGTTSCSAQAGVASATASTERAGTQDVRPVDPPVLLYQTHTMAECSMTVRHPNGVGSGWAGRSGYDWAAIDGATLASVALQKCIDSLNPVAIEPGRYTVVLEPQAVYDLVVFLIRALYRLPAEAGNPPFALEYDQALKLFRTKLGLKVTDERVTISHDPEDPLLGIQTKPAQMPVTWIEHGILKTLANDRPTHALPKLNDNLPSLWRSSFRMSGGPTSVPDMINSTARGLLVTRFSNITLLDGGSILCTGLTRDGLWLIEKGKITKAVKNMRFTESPLFVLNNLQELGTPVPVFSTTRDEPASALVPPIKANDFSFTSMIDAV